MEKTLRIIDRNNFVILTYPATGFDLGYEDGKIRFDSSLTSHLILVKDIDEPSTILDTIKNHFAIIFGYDKEKSLFYVKNSWGKEWGDNGYGSISFTELEKYLIPVISIQIIDNPELKLPVMNKPKKIEISEITSHPIINKDTSLTLSIQGVITNLGFRNLEIRSILIASTETDEKETL